MNSIDGIDGKAIIFTDVHIGRKQFSFEKAESTLEFMESEIKKSGIKNLFILGDFYDNRKFIDWQVFNRVTQFFESLKDINIFMVVGNHDIYYKNRIDENSISYLEKMFSNVKVIQKTELIRFNKKKVLFVPWLVDDEDENNPTKEQIKKADLILGHFEFINFELLPGIVSSHGFSTDNYKNKKVLSGHYHIMSEQNKIKYLGICEQMSWSDFNNRKGYHILDEELELSFVENETSERFVKLWFNSSAKNTITVEGYKINEKLYFETISDLLKQKDILSNNIRVYLRDIKEKIVYNNFIIALDMNHIEYTIIDVTTDSQEMICDDINASADDFDIKGIFNEMMKSNNNETQLRMFNEIYTEALQLNET